MNTFKELDATNRQPPKTATYATNNRTAAAIVENVFKSTNMKTTLNEPKNSGGKRSVASKQIYKPHKWLGNKKSYRNKYLLF